MAKYRNKPVTVEAVQWTGKNVSEMLAFAGTAVHDIYQVPGGTYSMIINTPAGKTHVSVGDYIIKCVEDGRVYPCNPDVFEKNYEPVDDLNEMLI